MYLIKHRDDNFGYRCAECKKNGMNLMEFEHQDSGAQVYVCLACLEQAIKRLKQEKSDGK